MQNIDHLNYHIDWRCRSGRPNPLSVIQILKLVYFIGMTWANVFMTSSRSVLLNTQADDVTFGDVLSGNALSA